MSNCSANSLTTLDIDRHDVTQEISLSEFIHSQGKTENNLAYATVPAESHPMSKSPTQIYVQDDRATTNHLLVQKFTNPNSIGHESSDSTNDDTWTQRVSSAVDAATIQAGVIVDDAAKKLKTVTFDVSEQIRATPSVQVAQESLRQEFAADSHEMAHRDYGVKGAIQIHNDLCKGVRDAGWHRSISEIPDPLIGGLTNGRLFSLIRRFNKDVFDVKAVPMKTARGLDLNEAWSDDHAKDKITLHLERLYLSVVLGMASFGKHVARLRSWKEFRRTSAFFAVYTTAWLFDGLVPLLLSLLIALVSSTEAREYLFPPVPLALVSINHGGLQTPAAGQLGTADSLTGAPEKQEGEAIEEEAANFVTNIRHIIQRVMGSHDDDDEGGNPLEQKIPRPIRKGMKAVKSAGAAPGHTGPPTDQTQKPMEDLLWQQLKPEKLEEIRKQVPHIIGELVDNWERFSNAVCPTLPFSPLSYLRIDAVLVPALLISLFVNYYFVYKATGFAIGFVIFGDPVITRSLEWLNTNQPRWLETLEPKNNILRGVPTNTQLTITLLRIGEAHETPIPAVPKSRPEDPDHLKIIDLDRGIPLDATRAEKIAAIRPPLPPLSSTTSKASSNEAQVPKHKYLSKAMRFFRKNAKVVVETKIGIDHIKAKFGDEKAQTHLGVFQAEDSLIFAGPSEYKARYQGQRGWVCINSTTLTFMDEHESMDGNKKVFDIAIKDIIELQRATTFVSKIAEKAVNWSSDKVLLTALEISTRVNGEEKSYNLTAIPERDELFNRLVAMGPQRWVNY